MVSNNDWQPAWILHQYDYRDSSRILECFTPQQGRVAVIAQGLKRPKSPWRGIAQPFRPLRLQHNNRGELHRLTGLESTGTVQQPEGEALYAAFYLNELLMRLLRRHDAQPDLFALYSRSVAALAADMPLEPVLRLFELQALNMLGYGIDFTTDYKRNASLSPQAWYAVDPNQGVFQSQSGNLLLKGEWLLALNQGKLPEDKAARIAINQLMRQLIRYHIGDKPLNSRELLIAARAMNGAKTPT
ncbi:MAG: DNA repair protein RecO [Gammaproteobacteria bacterium]|nr:DNA repair protein RecO [Gammaproteobacteria bacterium]